jgi:N-acyl-D-amino-acid deacylase
MLPRILVNFLSLAVFCATARAGDVLIRHATVYDGTGKAPFTADVRVHGDRITAVASHLNPNPGEATRDVHGLALSPGFIDMHTHADVGLLEDLNAATVTRQGVTTIFIGQDGESHFPLHDYFAHLEATPPAVNVASMIGHATLREQIMGKDLYRASTPEELAKMKALLAGELRAGAFGLSTGLEYEEGHFATTEEVVELSKVAAAEGGFYISHVRDEANHTFESFDEVLRIGREAHIPVEITHIKLGATSLWHQAAARMPRYFAATKREHIDLHADVYPYNYWSSTIRVIVPDRSYENLKIVSQAIADNGGPEAIRLAFYTPEPALGGKTLAEIAAAWHVTPAEAYVKIVRATSAEVGTDKPMESVIVTSMSEDDVRYFIGRPEIMFCSDGELHGAHPRGAGSFPRVLGRYVREQKVLPLESAIHKMTGLPARQLKLKDRGRIAPGFIADVVLFDPAVVADQSTIAAPEAPPLGIPAVMVAGSWVIDNGQPTGTHPGRVLRSTLFRP